MFDGLGNLAQNIAKKYNTVFFIVIATYTA